MEHQAICKQLRDFRTTHKISQRQMAATMTMEKKTYQRLERGQRKSLNLEDLEKISEATGIDLTQLLASNISIENMHEKSVANFCKSGQSVVVHHASELSNEELLTVIKEQRALIEDQKSVIELLRVLKG